MAHIDYYLSVLSPFVYLAGTRPAEIAGRHGATITYKPLDISGLFAAVGAVPMKERHVNRRELRGQELRRESKRAGKELNPAPAHWPTNAAPASYALIAAQEDGSGDVGAYLAAIGRASWAEEKDIADEGVIRAALEESGFDPALADKGLLAGAEAYSRNLEEAINAGAVGVPFFVVDGSERFWGQDRLEQLDDFLAGKL
ncbi:2-hydroxychromene-2-carboxylate isomerase [Pseudoroseicyclus tamaricis]|uniref:2-hydroxychromene-2-carboxylate isomerase n=1 Tax=Pseudoroseicyclus tamaricis TaxID=2705421 RepID=A0A6B2JPK4_9RHOB|nr:2-hydroxychromene-2-carboxylate isomerase [Pseudoroseicyclus tamaricis]NDU99929.1 2-hydroxychromene-2-carboxylate isomerase [Pseudoroseicyclus tamaricis]